MNGLTSFSIRQMIAAAVIAIVLGLVLLLYPGLTFSLMTGAFWSIQVLITIFIIIYAISEIMRNSKAGHSWAIFVPIIIGIAAIALVWLIDVRFVYFVIALFFILSGISEIAGSFVMPYGKFFIFLLGLVNIMIGAVIIKYPLVLPLLIAWYILFWGVSRLLLALEIRGLMKMPK